MGLRLLFRRLVIIGPARNYQVEFHDGVNIVAGPVMTGKSTVLRLLDHAMGANRQFEFPEIAKCTHVLVECNVGGEVITIRRSLRNMHTNAELFEATIDSVLATNQKGLSVMPRHDANQPSISSEVMRRLGWGELNVKAAPKQDSSAAGPFSLRDLMFLVYVDQTRISDERGAFMEREFYKAIKWRAGVEISFALYDQAATQVADALNAALAEEQGLVRYLEAAREFLDHSEVPDIDTLREQLAQLEEQKKEILDRRQLLHESSEEELGQSLELVRRRSTRADELSTNRARVTELERTLTQLGRLRVQYDRERAQLQFLEESNRLISSIPVSRCPGCLQPIGHHVNETASCYVCTRPLPEPSDAVTVNARLRSVKRRITDLESYIEELRGTARTLTASRVELEAELAELGSALARVQQTTLLPSNRLLAELGETLGLLDRRASSAQEQLFLRERAQGHGSALLGVQERTRQLRAQLTSLKENAPDRVEATSSFSNEFGEALAAMRFPYLDGVSIDRDTFHPIVRDAEYGALSSKGAVSLVVTAWHLALLSYSLKKTSLFPMLLLLDSPLSHVGRDSADPDFMDQQIADAFYELLKEWHQDSSDDFQIIVCDNHPPESARSLIAVEFTGKKGVGRIGLISDED